MNPLRFTRGLAVIVLAGSLAACATNTSRFEWGSSESSLYMYAKKPDQKPAYEAALRKAVEKGRTSGRVAPGMLAELGYVRLEDGDLKEATALFNEEMVLFPESRPFLTRILSKAGGAPTASTSAGGSQ
jgi:hypothetical protein